MHVERSVNVHVLYIPALRGKTFKRMIWIESMIAFESIIDEDGKSGIVQCNIM